MTNSLADLLALHSVPGMGPVRLRQILTYFENDAAAAWQESNAWGHIPEISADVCQSLQRSKLEVEPQKVYDCFLQSGACVVTLEDEAYPSALKDILDPPPLLFYKGTLPQDDDICVAMIGSRSSTSYGKQVGEILSRDLAKMGIWVIGGMARGIDSICHEGALKAGGKTVAVLGTGIDIPYPRENAALYQQIILNGAVVSELPVGSPALPQHFPMRNRIISGLSRGVVVIEAGAKSGTLLTVDHALEQNRDIFTVPGPITSPMSRGTNNLIRMGIKIVLSSKDIYEEYLPYGAMLPKKSAKDKERFTGQEKEILDLMTLPVHFDDLLRQVNLTPQKLASLLTIWEIRGIISQLPGKYYHRITKDI